MWWWGEEWLSGLEIFPGKILPECPSFSPPALHPESSRLCLLSLRSALAEDLRTSTEVQMAML